MHLFNRSMDASVFAAVIVSAGLVACSSSDGGQDTLAGGGAPNYGGAPAGLGGLPGTAGTPTGVAGSPTGAAGSPTGVAGASPIGAGGSLPSGAGGNVALGGAPGAGGAVSQGGEWTPDRGMVNGVLQPPAAADGFQLKTPVFDLQPGQEIFNCFHVAVPNDAVFPVGEWDAQMEEGSHHFILYRAGGDATATPQGVLTNGGCTQGFGGTTWLYTQGTPRSHLLFPDGVAMELAGHEKLNFDMHYINLTEDVIHAQIILNVNKVKSAQYQKADAQISFNTGIFIPPNGTQTVQGDCTPAPGANYFVMQTHTHRRGKLAVVNRLLADGKTLGEELVKTDNWDNPQAHIWQQAPFLTFQPGEKFHYRCDFQNDRNQYTIVGTSADTNEMCMAEAYFFPASATTPTCN